MKTKATKDGYIFITIKRRMFGLPQIGLLTQYLIEERVGKSGYYQSESTPGLLLHKTCSIALYLCVDYFGVKYVKKEDKMHLLEILNQHYKVTVDNKGTQHLGITLEWDYKNLRVHISIPGYVPKALKIIGHEPPTKLQY